MDEDLTTHLELFASGGRIIVIASFGSAKNSQNFMPSSGVPRVSQMSKPGVAVLSEVEILSAMLVEVNA
jgi:hypothetical protein